MEELAEVYEIIGMIRNKMNLNEDKLKVKLRAIGCIEEWFSAGIINNDNATYNLIMGELSKENQDDDHLRYFIISKFLEKDTYTKAEWRSLVKIAQFEAVNTGLGMTIFHSLIKLQYISDDQFSQLHAYLKDESSIRVYKRFELLRSLMKEKINNTDIETAILNGDQYVHDFLLTEISLSNNQLDSLSKLGKTKAIRNRAKQFPKEKTN